MIRRPERRWRPARHIGLDLRSLADGTKVKIKGYGIEWDIIEQKQNGGYVLIGCIPSEPIATVSYKDITEVQL